MGLRRARCRGRALGRRPLGAPRCIAKPEIARGRARRFLAASSFRVVVRGAQFCSRTCTRDRTCTSRGRASLGASGSARRESSLRSCPSAAAASSAGSIACYRGMHRHCWFVRHGSRGTNSRRGIAALPFRLRRAAACSERPPPGRHARAMWRVSLACARLSNSRCTTMEARALRDPQPGDSAASSSEPGHEQCRVEGCQ